MEKRVVVTGTGVVSPIGNDVETFWKNLLEGYCGIEVVEEFANRNMAVKIAGLIKDLDPGKYGVDKGFVRKQDAFALYALISAIQAMEQSGLKADGDDANIDSYRLGVNISSGVGGLETIIREAYKLYETPSGEWVSPLLVPTIISNIAAGNVAQRFNAKGPSYDVTTACASSTYALGLAYHAIKHGYVDAMITGGAEHCAIPLGMAGFINMKALTKEEDPKHASLPFNLDRGGFVLSDGAASLVLEEYEHAKNRGANILAEVVGFGATCDAYHFTAPRPDGTTQARCIADAIAEAGFNPSSDVVYVNAHGTGTKMNDATETLAYKLAFGDYASKLHISSTKSMHGHMLGATGAAEAIASILALDTGIIPPTINLDNPDPECDLDYTPNEPVKADITLAISDSFGFGGHNACIAFRKVNK